MIIREFKLFLADIRSQYWFIPMLSIFGGICLALILSQISYVPSEQEFKWLFLNEASGARSLMSTLATSILGVTGVAFSLTLLAISHASSQIGPRIITGLLEDRKNQIVLGILLATYVYCIVLLKEIKVGGNGGEVFVPSIALLGALILCLLSVISLIYFFHHIPRLISVTRVINMVGSSLLTQIKSPYIESVGADYTGDAISFKSMNEVSVECINKGFVEVIDAHKLLSIAQEYDIIIECLIYTGDFVYEGTSLVKIYGDRNLADKVHEKIRNLFVVGVSRSIDQDLMFSTQLLFEIAAKALSPGVNDPVSAKDCLYQVEAAVFSTIGNKKSSLSRADREGDLRLILKCSFSPDVLHFFLINLLQYASKDFMICSEIMEMLLRLKCGDNELDQKIEFIEKVYIESIDKSDFIDYQKSVLKGSRRANALLA